MKLMELYDDVNFFIDETVLDEDYPTTWDAEAFKRLSSFAERQRYAEQNLQRISSGTGRLVYKIDNEKVLKLAKNKKGVAQNEVEIEYGNDSYFTILARVFDSHPDALWVEMELARVLTKPLFKKITGYSFDEFASALFYQISTNRGRGSWTTKPNNMDIFYDSELFTDVVEYLMGTDSPDGDMRRISSYGIVSRNGEDTIVIIDYGLSKDVYSSYYDKNPIRNYYG